MKLPESLILDKTFVFNVSKLLVDRDITEGTRLIDNLDTLSANDSVIADYDEFDIAFARIQQEFSDEIYIKYDTLKDLYHRYIVYRDYMGEENLRDLAEIQNHKYPIYDESRSIDRSLVPCVFIRYVINHPNNLTELSNHICDLEHVMDTAESVGKDMEDVKIGLAQLDDWFSDLYNVYEYYYENFAE